MARPTRYPKLISAWLEDDVADALESIAKSNGLTVSHVVREIFAGYLTYIGAIKPRPQVNGHANEARVN